jgi:ATP-dependent DNA ligase
MPSMSLALQPPFIPMEALSVDKIPIGTEWQYEPKWDGFRSVAFRDGNSIQLQSKSGRDLTRYFPELVEALRQIKANKFVLDGEIVVPIDGSFSFDALLQRIHPAESRIRSLMAQTPAMLILFDLLVDVDGNSLLMCPLKERRNALEGFFSKYCRARRDIRLSPATSDLKQAKRWLNRVGGALDGIIAKRLDLDYQSGERTGMQKVKNFRSADCVVGGFRYGTASKLVGSLLLGLYDDEGLLHHVGFTSTIRREDKASVTRKLTKLVAEPGFTGNAPGGPSRWSTKRTTEWKPVRPRLVVEVCYDHFTGNRFRHGTTLLRWRPDKDPRQCTMEQLTQETFNFLSLLQ